MQDFNFTIDSKGIVSTEFLKLGIDNFESASMFIARLTYKRNSDKKDVLAVIKEQGGTCSTKHAALRKLALENGRKDVKLMLGIFKMDSHYAPAIKKTLDKYQLNYIPEAHNYLKFKEEYFDFTKPNASYSDFKNQIVFEQELEHHEIADHKVSIHQKFLVSWLQAEKLNFSLEEIWKIREQCIQDLQKNRD